MNVMPTPSDSSRIDGSDAGATDADDRLIFLAEALTLVPFSDTTLRRAIS